MQFFTSILTVVLVVSRAEVDQHEENPVSKVVELMSQLQDRMIKKGAASQEIYNEFAAWCTKRQQDFSLELKSDQHEKKDLEAQVVDDESKKKTEDMKGDDEAEDIAVSDADLSKATKLREKEATDFAKEEKELLEVVTQTSPPFATMTHSCISGVMLLALWLASVLPAAAAPASLLRAGSRNSACDVESQLRTGAPKGSRDAACTECIEFKKKHDESEWVKPNAPLCTTCYSVISSCERGQFAWTCYDTNAYFEAVSGLAHKDFDEPKEMHESFGDKEPQKCPA